MVLKLLYLGNGVVRHELCLVNVSDVAAGHLLIFFKGPDVQAHHAVNRALGDLLLPSLLWSAQGDLHIGLLSAVELEVELGIVLPRGSVDLLLALVIFEEMASSAVLWSPGPSHDCMSGVIKLLDLAGL